jgi:hypothetical protein
METSGKMTAVMRSVKAEKKILRVGVLGDGRVMDERLLYAPEDVTVGEDGTFFAEAPRTRVFEKSADGYKLCISPDMTGRVAFAGSIS